MDTVCIGRKETRERSYISLIGRCPAQFDEKMPPMFFGAINAVTGGNHKRPRHTRSSRTFGGWDSFCCRMDLGHSFFQLAPAAG